jgi:hypothetical protein
VSTGVSTQVIHERKPVSATVRRRGRWFFAGIATVACATVFVGFARTYYVKGMFSAPSLPPLFHLHGVLFTAWMLLFVMQTCLVATRHTGMHRRLGIVGGLLVLPMVASGFSVAITAARGEGPVSSAVARGEFVLALPELPPLVAMVIPLTSVLLFALFAGAGLAYRRQPDVHKRLMVLATIAMLPPALGRALATVFGASYPALFFGVTVLFLVAIGIHDWRTRGRVHPVSLWGGLFLAVSFPGRLALGNTNMWLRFADWLTF